MRTQGPIRWRLVIATVLMLTAPIVGTVLTDHTGAAHLATALLVSVAMIMLAWAACHNSWRGYTPSRPGWTFQPVADEFPVVADHRAFFADGRPRNLVCGPGWTAFELIRDGRRIWYFAVPLRRSYPRCHVWLDPRGRSGAPFEDRYLVDGPVPDQLRAALESSFDRPDLTVLGDVLLAAEWAMTPRHFEQWIDHEGRTVLAAARALDEPAAQPAIAPPDPARNVWHPESSENGPEPVWTQPPR